MTKEEFDTLFINKEIAVHVTDDGQRICVYDYCKNITGFKPRDISPLDYDLQEFPYIVRYGDVVAGWTGGDGKLDGINVSFIRFEEFYKAITGFQDKEYDYDVANII